MPSRCCRGLFSVTLVLTAVRCVYLVVVSNISSMYSASVMLPLVAISHAGNGLAVATARLNISCSLLPLVRQLSIPRHHVRVEIRQRKWTWRSLISQHLDIAAERYSTSRSYAAVRNLSRWRCIMFLRQHIMGLP
jgi:hypothetical protein